MKIIPAIDIRNGQCVRLQQGDFARQTVFSDDPVAMALHWQKQGATRLHIVDLDGALEGEPINQQLIAQIIKAVDMEVQIGGGVRTFETIEAYLSIGVAEVILGTAAVKNPTFAKDAISRYPHKLIIGLDARGHTVSTEGWVDDYEQINNLLPLVQTMSSLPIAAIVYTDIAKDGMLQGVNTTMLQEVLQASLVPVIASGGVASIDDIHALNTLDNDKLFGIITGRAIYDGRLNLADALVAYQ